MVIVLFVPLLERHFGMTLVSLLYSEYGDFGRLISAFDLAFVDIDRASVHRDASN